MATLVISGCAVELHDERMKAQIPTMTKCLLFIRPCVPRIERLKHLFCNSHANKCTYTRTLRIHCSMSPAVASGEAGW
jgi:hypothetical protein